MQVCFDGTTLKEGQTGVGYYTEHLLQHLLREAPQDQFVIISNALPFTSKSLPAFAQIHPRQRLRFRSLWMQTLALSALDEVNPDLAHFTNSVSPLGTRVPTVLTIHDMSLSLFPQFHPIRRRLTRPLVRLCARKAKAIITVSESARRDMMQLWGISSDGIHVIPEAPAPEFRPLGETELLEETRRRYGLSQRFILYVGTIEPRKNLTRLVRAFARMTRKRSLSHQLVLAGSLGWGFKEVIESIDALGLHGSVRLLGYVPYADLPALYNLSEFFVFPSIYEGFGLPVVEAMASGTPVVCSRESSLSEVGRDAVEFIDPLKVESIEQALIRLATDEELRKNLATEGLARVARLSWRKAAQETLTVYRSVLGGSLAS